ncbi:MAG TPA: anion transporter [Thermodesulfobacteriota bacterium]
MRTALTLIVFGLTYLGLALGRVPRTRLDRAGIVVVGAALMFVTGAVDLDRAARAVDAPTIFLLFGMMLVIAHLRLAGFFELVSLWALERAKHPFVLLVATVGVSGVLSALFVNDVVCLVLTPIVVGVLRPLALDPVPYLIALATASNIGSAATLTGNPQNMLIGSFSRMPYLDFARHLVPVALAGLVLDVLVIGVVYRRVLFRRPEAPAPSGTADAIAPRVHPRLLRVALVVTAGLLLAFLAGASIAVAAVVAGAVLLVAARVRPLKIYRQVDWALLVLFAGLFVVLAGLEGSGLVARGFELLGPARLEGPWTLSAVALALSNVVSNVPAVLLFRSVVPTFGDPDAAWRLLAMASTFAGNLTLIGSVANLIVVEQARAHGAPRVTFTEYLRVGVPVTLLTTAAGVLLLG